MGWLWQAQVAVLELSRLLACRVDLTAWLDKPLLQPLHHVILKVVKEAEELDKQVLGLEHPATLRSMNNPIFGMPRKKLTMP